MSSIVSSTDWMKQALPCGYSYWVGGAFGLSGLAIVKVIAFARALADAVLVVKADVEPDRGIECAMLIEAKPGQFIVKRSPPFAYRRNSRRAIPNLRWCA